MHTEKHCGEGRDGLVRVDAWVTVISIIVSLIGIAVTVLSK